MELNQTKEEILRSVNERVSALMREERLLKGRSIRTVARKLKIKRRHIKRWEEGKKSPAISTMLKVTAFYGKTAHARCQSLIQAVLDEKSVRERNDLIAKANPPKKLPAVIWAEAVQFSRAA